MILPAFLQFWAILKPMGTLADFSRFQPGRPEPLQTARFYQHSFNFERYRSQWVLLLTFRGFSLAAQNPSRLHDFTSIPSILNDIEANGCFCLLFAVIAWPSRTHPDCMILLAYLQFLTVLGCSGCGAASVSCHVKWVQKSTQNRPKINPKPSQNRPKIDPKST